MSSACIDCKNDRGGGLDPTKLILQVVQKKVRKVKREVRGKPYFFYPSCDRYKRFYLLSTDENIWRLALFFGGDGPVSTAFSVDADPTTEPNPSKPAAPESSGSVSFRIAGGEKSRDASLVPTRDLLGVSGAVRLSSIPLLINWLVDAQLLPRDLRIFLLGE